MGQKKLLAIAFIIVIVELLLIMFLVDATKNKISQSLILNAYEVDKQLAAQISKSLEQDLKAVQNKLSLIALFPEIQTGSSESCSKKLDQVFPLVEGKVANLVKINEKGELYCAINRESIGINVLENEDLKKIILAPEHKPVLHRVVLSSVSNKYVAGIHVPVVSQGVFEGSIGGVVYFDELKDKYFKDFTLLESGRVMLIDDNGDVLYHPTSPELVGKNLLSDEIVNQLSELDREDYKRQLEQVLDGIRHNVSGTIQYQYQANSEMIAVYHPVEILPDRHWAVIVTVPLEEITSQVDKDPLIAGFKNFSALAIAMIVTVLITQISLFVYFISHLNKHLKAQKQ